MDELPGVDFAAVAKDRLYRCLDRLVAHKDALHRHLVDQWRTLFDAKFDILLYDLTSTYFEGQCQQIPKARHGYSRDGRPDCRQVVIALVVTPDGLPLAYEVLAGNTADRTTRKTFLARSEDRRQKEQAIHRRKLQRFVKGLNALKRRPVSRDVLLQKIGALRAKAGQVKRFVKIHLPKEGETVTRSTFRCSFDGVGGRAWRQREGAYLLRGFLPAGVAEDGVSLWQMYMQLVQVEQAFEHFKTDLAIRPIEHQTQVRVEAHILVAFPGHALLAGRRRADPAGGAGETGGDPDGGRVYPHDRRPAAGDAALHRAGGRAAVGAGQTEPAVAAATPAADPRRGGHPAGGPGLL